TGIVAGPISYALDGQQYVAVMAGWGGVAPLIGGDAANAPGVRNISRLLVFKLDGKAQLSAPPAQAQAAARIPAAVDAPAETIAKGKELYHMNCSMCHGVGVVSGGLVPDLRKSADAMRSIFDAIVLKGALQARGMPSFAGALTETEVAAIKTYVLSKEREDFEKSRSNAGR
ncbi:MAG: c-type cytochrome, partial [Noviherbaspirillum sp.]